MANTNTPPLLLLLLLLLLVSIATAVAEKSNHRLVQSQSPAPKPRKEKLSHLRFYWHDILSGRNPTAITIAQAPTTRTSSTGFGLVNMIDDPLTAEPSMNSKLLGRAQGLYASASQETVGLMMAMNFAFLEGKYNGSTLTVLGRNAVLNDVREMPVLGGSGLFRFARGYAQARTHWLDFKTGDAVVEYNVYVLHY